MIQYAKMICTHIALNLNIKVIIHTVEITSIMFYFQNIVMKNLACSILRDISGVDVIIWPYR